LREYRYRETRVISKETVKAFSHRIFMEGF